MPKIKTQAVEMPKLNRPLCTVCKSRFAFNDDGTCNDAACPSYSARVKARAGAMKAERRALEAKIAEGRAEQEAEAVEHERAYREKMARDDRSTSSKASAVPVDSAEFRESSQAKASEASWKEVLPKRGVRPSSSKAPTRPVGASSPAKAATVASKAENVPTHAVDAKNGVSVPTPSSIEAIGWEAIRTVGWRWRSEDRRFGLLEITDEKATDAYLVKWLATRASIHQFTMTKLEVGRETCYWVYVPAKASDLSAASGCGCPGMASHRHCRHVEALIELRDSGRL